MGKVTSGDGSAFAPMRPWQVLHRTVFGAEHRGVRYVVDVALFDDRAVLYADGTQVAQGNMACRFPVLGGCIEAASTLYGLRRMHLVLDDGVERQLESLDSSRCSPLSSSASPAWT